MRFWIEQHVVQPLRRRPALLAAICLIVGIALHRYFSKQLHLVVIALCALLAMAVGSIIAAKGKRIVDVLLALAIVLAGVCLAQIEAFRYPRDHIANFVTASQRLAEIEVEITQPPRLITGAYTEFRALPPRQVMLAEARRVRTWEGWTSAGGAMMVQLNQPHPQVAQGQTVRLIGMIERPAPASNPGQFDWAKYYREQRVLVSMHVPHADNVQILSSAGTGPIASLRRTTRQLLARGFSVDQSLDHALLRALLLGDSDPEMRDVQEQFKRTGTSHHLAISGMHVAVLGGVVLLICRLLCLSPRVSAYAMLVTVVLYGTVALPSPPVMRSVLLCAVVGVGLLLRRDADPVQMLAIVAIAMLVYHPLDLFNAGFQLSFGTVLGLILFTRPLLKFMERQSDIDARVAMQGRQQTTVQHATRRLDRSFQAALAAAIVAWVVSMPLIAWHFEQLNPWSVPASIAMAPIVFLALIGGAVKIALTLLWPGAAALWAALAAQPVAWMRSAVDALATLPAGDVALPAPPITLVMGYYALLFLLLVPIPYAGVKWCLRGGLAVAALAIVVLPYRTTASQLAATRDALKVTILSVGAGQCAVIEPPSGRVILIDAGSTSLQDLLRRCVGPYLRHEGKTALDTVIITHANLDHFSAVDEIAAAYGVREVLVAAPFRSHAKGNSSAEMLLESLASLERPPRSILPGDVIPLGRATEISVLWPPPGRADLNANDASLVLQLSHHGRRILFTGDVQNAAMRALLDQPQSLRADVLIAPHHGSSETLTEEFVRAVGASTIVSSNDRTLSRKQRAFESLIGDTPLLRTNVGGAITITVEDDGTVRVEPFLIKAAAAAAAATAATAATAKP